MSSTSPEQGGPSRTGILVETRKPSRIVYPGMRTCLEMDGGNPMVRPWGETFFPVVPGEHTVRCHVHFPTHEGDCAVRMIVPEGGVVHAT